MSSIRGVALYLFAILLMCHQISCEIVEIDDGMIEGTVMETRMGESFHAFLKIPFAEAPVDDLRFLEPQPVLKWSDVKNAMEYSPMCTQTTRISGTEVSEDCLYLNVFSKNLPDTPNVSLKPVIAYIHGGAFQIGSASEHEPNLLMERDVVLVTINYRLGAFGFLSLGTREIPGNAGYKDQVQALRWIQENIAKFGGDPQSVTLMGNSAGAYSTTAHMVSPMSQGLFHRVIALSGSVTYQRKLETNHLYLGMQLADKLNCTTSDSDDMIACLRNIAASDINVVELRDYPECTIMTWFPVIEIDFGQERFLIDEPVNLFRNGNFSIVPLIIGRTQDEFVNIPSNILHGEMIEKLNTEFDEVAPHCFFYEAGTENSKKISKSLRDAYFPYETIDIRSFESLCNIFNDGYIGYGVHRLAHLVSNYTDVFYYHLSFSSRYSYYYYLHDKPYGVHHGDEMQYILTTWFVGPRIEIDDPENLMVERFTRIIAQFALTGNPNNDTDIYLSEMNWPTHDSINEFYLDMGNHLVEKNGLTLKRYAVWDDIEKSSAVSIRLDVSLLLVIVYLTAVMS